MLANRYKHRYTYSLIYKHAFFFGQDFHFLRCVLSPPGDADVQTVVTAHLLVRPITPLLIGIQ